MSSNATVTCAPEDVKWPHILLMPLPYISGLVNFVVLLAATIYRKRLLRHNYVYLCVCSTLLSHMFFLGLHLWEETTSYMLDPAVSAATPKGKMILMWTLCQSAAIAMLFGMCCNLGATIYVMVDSSYFQIASSVNEGVEAGNEQAKANFMRAKRLKAIVLVIISWLVPLVLTILGLTLLNCTPRCRCSHGAAGELCPSRLGCSRVWAPMTNSFMSISVAFWFLEIAGLAVLIHNGIRNFEKFTFGKKSPGSGSAPEASEAREVQLPGASSIHGAEVEQGDQEEEEEPSTNGAIPDTTVGASKASRSRFNLRWFRSNPRLRCVSVLSTVFLAGTLPLALCFFLDFAGARFNIRAAKVVSMVLVQLYTLLCPILLATYLSNLRTAVLQLVCDVLFCL